MILYNKDKKAYVNYVEQKLRSDIVTDISLASELTEASFSRRQLLLLQQLF